MMTIQEALSRAGADVLHISTPHQVSCPFHGADINKSMRVYPATDSCYCWTCGRAWNPIAVMAEYQGVDYYAALRKVKMEFGDAEYVARAVKRENSEMEKLFLAVMDDARISRAKIDELLTRAARGYDSHGVMMELRILLANVL